MLPNFATYAASIAKNPNYDPGNRFTIPWQSGFTGIAYNPKRDRPRDHEHQGPVGSDSSRAGSG